MRLLACCLFLFLLHFVSALREPFVILPTAIRWRSENSITVIPRDWSKIPLNIEVFVTAKESALSLSEQLFYDTRKISDLGSAHTFTFNSSHQPDAIEYGIKVAVTGHKDYYTVLYGVSNLKTISIQTDKGYYRPGENINVRILPIDGENQLYKSDLKISLVNPQGFNVITNTVNIPEKQTRFLQAKFEIPEFAPHGFWSITVKPTNSSLPWMFTNLRIRVQDYSLPKFFITMGINEMEADNKIKISIIAKYFHGQPVKGSIFVVCGSQTQLLAGNKPTETSPTAAVAPPKPTGGFEDSPTISKNIFHGVHIPPSLQRKNGTKYFYVSNASKFEGNINEIAITASKAAAQYILSRSSISSTFGSSSFCSNASSCWGTSFTDKTTLVDGSWEDKADISSCLDGAQNGIIRFTATVTDVDNDKNIAIREFQPKAPNFQMIPLRPFFDITTKFARIYFKSLMSDAIGNKIEGLYQCISNDASHNGINSSFSSKIEDSIEIQIQPECVMYIFRAHRISGTRDSDEAFLILPSVSGNDDLNLSLINTSKKVTYNVGDKFEASIPSLMNFVVICNKKDLVQRGTVSINGILTFPIEQSMQGYCILHVFGASNQKKTQSDMWIFFVEASTCPERFSLKSSADVLHPPSNVTITVQAPKGSIAVVRGIDEKLYHMINTIQAPKSNIYWNLNVFNEPSREENAPRLVNFINTMSVYQNIRETCRFAGKRGPSNPFFGLPPPSEVSDISNYCIRDFNKSSIIALTGMMYAITDGKPVQPAVSVATIFAHPQAHSPKFKGGIHDDIPLNLNDAMKGQAEIADELFLRTFFPEVWYFDDIKFSTKTEKNLTLQSPHSIGKWLFTSNFWNSGEQDVCAVEPVTIETRRHVFMEIDLPSQVYENETIQARVIVNGDNFDDEKKLAVCFTALTPVVCADMGKKGYMAETEYTRVVLNQTQTRSEKYIYLKFLKEGLQNVSFELREEVEVIGGDTNHCIDSKAKKFDKILKTVIVKRRLDQKEHFRQLNIYAQRKVFNNPEVAADVARDVSFLEKTNTIRFKQNLINDQETETEVELDHDTQVIATFLEIAEYQPSFPLGVASEEITYSRRPRRSVDSKNFASTLMDYAFTAYDQKQGKLNGNILDNSLKQEATINELQRLRMELFQFSNCSIYSDSCAFGEFGPPVGGVEPSIVYTATVTSLMCEESVEDQYVCGLLHFLSNITDQGVENFDADFHGQISFSSKDEETWFLRAILRQTFLDCRMRECMKSNSVKQAVKKLVETFYSFDTQQDHDIRIEAAIASVAPQYLSGNLRQKIREKADTTRMPYWRVPESLRENDIDESVIKSMDVTANSLALLAFVNQSAEVYDHYRSQFNLPRLAEWIIEEQTSDKRFQTAIDTFYAWRALYRYNERLTGPLESNNIRVQLLNAGIPMREYSNTDMPFSLQLPARSRNFTLHTIGEGRIVMGVRVLATPRKRPKRAEDNVPAIGITVIQSRVSQTDNFVMQLVCIRTKSKRVQTLEVEHNLYTGFSTDFSKFQLLANTTQAGVSLIGLQRVTVGGIYFTMNGISPEFPACYQIVIREPAVSYTAEYLAPVTIDAHFNQISGQAVLYASEIKTILQVRHKRRHHVKRRSKRSGVPVGADLVDTICLDHGSCTCSELSCSAKCLTCKRKNDAGKLHKELVAQIKSPGRFGLLATHISSTSVLVGNENYTRAVMNVGYSIGRNLIFGCAPKIDQFILWIRACNKHACTKLVKDKLYLLIGSEKGFFEDSISTTDESQTNSTQIILKHYLLHDGDRLEGGVDLNDDEEVNSSCHQIIKELLILRIPCK